MTDYILLGLLAGVFFCAFDAHPSKKSNTLQPNVPGKRFDIFAGDPERVKRVNEIRREDFLVSATLEPSEVSLLAASTSSVLRAGVTVISKAKRPKTLSFPDAQRIDVVFRDAKENEVYRWSIGKQFIQSIGTSMVMPGEKLVFLVDIPLHKWEKSIQPGTYQVEVMLANYPEFTGKTNLVVKTN